MSERTKMLACVFVFCLSVACHASASQTITVTQPLSFRQRLQAGEPAAVSAVGTWFGAFCAASIGILAFRLNRNIRRGQAAHEQIRMLLEIDTELIKSPELWAVHGAEFIPAHTGPEGASVLIAELKERAAALAKSAVATVPLAKTQEGQLALAKLAESIDGLAKMADAAAAYAKIWEGLPASGSTVTAEGVVQGGSRTAEQLKLLALLLRYFNMFDFVYVSWGRKWGLWGKRRDDWNAWVNTMREFFDNNGFAREEWAKFSGKGIYSKSFTEFLNRLITPTQ
jgi:hypothetical protein